MSTILIVDDSATSRMLFRAHVPRAAGFAVLEADTLERTLELAREHRPDLVVLDYNMPVRNGVEIGEVLKAEGIGAQLVLLTANTQRSVVEAATRAGFDAVVEKPITREKVEGLLARMP